MQPYVQAAHPTRATAAAALGAAYHAPAAAARGQLKTVLPTTRIPVGGHYVAAAPGQQQQQPQQQSHQPPPLPPQQTQPVQAPSPVQGQGPPTQAGIAKGQQPQLWNLPRFKPPVFEGANGILPCPDSPESTPRGEEPIGTEEAEGCSAALSVEAPAAVTALPTSGIAGPAAPPSGGAGHQGSLPLSRSGGQRTAALRPGSQGPPPERGEEASASGDMAGAYQLGSIVEYKSRSSGLWILARVECFDAEAGSYRLDVQPNAKPERIRPRGSGGTVELRNHLQPQHSYEGPAPTAREACPVPTSSGSEESKAAALRAVQQQVAELQVQLAQERELKDRYFAELCICREQLARALETSGGQDG